VQSKRVVSLSLCSRRGRNTVCLFLSGAYGQCFELGAGGWWQRARDP